MHPRAVMFDLDNTLAASKQPLTPVMAGLLAQLLSRMPVAVISGGALSQLETQVANQLPSDANISHLYLLPTSGAALFTFTENTWTPAYQEALSEDDIRMVTDALTKGATSTGLINLEKALYGPYIENRGAQVSLSALGQQAPIDEKEAWDPTHVKRQQLQAAIAPHLPDFDVKIGGTTTIDVTKHGINKAYGIRKLSEHLNMPVADILYVGDELREGGNDEAALETGIPTRAVADPSETIRLIEELLETV